MNFKTSFGEPVTLDEMMDDIFSYIQEDMDREYKIIVGTDAQVHGKRRKKKTVYATVVVCHRIGKGARFWVAKEELSENIGIKERLINEVAKLVEVVTLLQDAGIEAFVDHNNFEVHLDIGHNGRSREVITQCVGWMEGLGLNYKIKPDAYAATHIADHFCH